MLNLSTHFIRLHLSAMQSLFDLLLNSAHARTHIFSVYIAQVIVDFSFQQSKLLFFPIVVDDVLALNKSQGGNGSLEIGSMWYVSIQYNFKHGIHKTGVHCTPPNYTVSATHQQTNDRKSFRFSLLIAPHRLLGFD